MSYAALYKGTKPIITLAAGSGGGTPWVRPAWPALADLTSTDNVFTAIYGVDSTDSNFVALAVTTSSGTYTVNWGDGTIDTGIASGVQANHTYDYATITASVVGEFKPVVVTVTTIGGNITTFDLQKKNPLNATTSAINWLDIAINASGMTSLIIGSANIVMLNLLQKFTIYNHSVTNMSNMFGSCFSLKNVLLFNTVSVTNMEGMFNGCRSLKSVALFNTAAVTNMSSMFNNCFSLQSVPLFNTAAVTTMANMFNNCFSLQSVPLFNTAAVTTMSTMFSNCTALQSVPFFDASTTNTMNGMFNNCPSLQSAPMFNTAAVINMGSMFTNCYSLQSVPLFNTAAVTDMSSMFQNCAVLQSIPLFNTVSVTNMARIFQNCTALQIVPLLNTAAIISSSNSSFIFYSCRSLCKGRTNGIMFSISYDSCKLSTAALNDIFTGLGTASGSRNVVISNNPGAATCDRSIATAKGWTVIG